MLIIIDYAILMIIFDIYADYAIDISDYAASWLSHYAEG
jgi:hypothetical protein